MSNPKPDDASPPAEVATDPLAGLCRGRIVLYHPAGYEKRNVGDDGPWPSMVTKVGDVPKPGTCTLNVNLPMPLMVSQGGDPVERRVGVAFSATGEAGTWGWMFDGQGTSRKAPGGA